MAPFDLQQHRDLLPRSESQVPEHERSFLVKNKNEAEFGGFPYR